MSTSVHFNANTFVLSDLFFFHHNVHSRKKVWTHMPWWVFFVCVYNVYKYCKSVVKTSFDLFNDVIARSWILYPLIHLLHFLPLTPSTHLPTWLGPVVEACVVAEGAEGLRAEQTVTLQMLAHVLQEPQHRRCTGGRGQLHVADAMLWSHWGGGGHNTNSY